MAAGNHYILTLQGEDARNGQACQNVFCYQQVAGTGSHQALLDRFGDTQFPAIMNILSDYWRPVQLVVINLDDPTDYGNLITAVGGQVTGEAEPSFVAAAFEIVRSSRAFNNGRKSFGPIAQADVLQNGPSDDMRARCNTLAALLLDPIADVDTSSSFVPRIWRRPGTYASGVVAAPGQFNAPSGVVFRSISSQLTRKSGRGS